MDNTSRILVVDDEPHLRLATVRILEAAGYQVLDAANGQDAVASVKSFLPDLVLLDVVMPDMDGIHVYQHLKAEAALADSFVVFLSGSRTASDEQAAGLETGADGYIVRPISNRELLARVETFLRIQRTEKALRESEEKLQEYAEHLEQSVAEKMRQLEIEHAKAVQMDKMASLGEMATGVAHELTQPLAAISFDADYLKLVTQKVQSEPAVVDVLASSVLDLDELREIGENIAHDVLRCRRIIDHLREFGRKTQGDITCVDLNRVIENGFILVGERLRHHNVSVNLNLAENLPLIRADVHKLEQVFLNLVSNAEYALERRAESQMCPSYQKTLCLATMCENNTVVVEISDNGSGIPEEQQPRIFEPFFTTKPVGEGTGLGLSISYSIVAEFGGEMSFQSEVGVGTTFILRFPVHTNAGS